jgi:hypothetical protein
VFRKSIGMSCAVQQLSVEWTGYVLTKFTSYTLRLSLLTKKQTTTYFANHNFHCVRIEKVLWGNKTFDVGVIFGNVNFFIKGIKR